MSPELENALFRQYPQLYRDCGRPPEESLMGFGFECGDGWYTVIRDLSARLEQLNAAGEDIRASQVKEKFGCLRFYAHGLSDEAEQLVAAAEAASARICERCGAPGETRWEGYVHTLCDACRPGRGPG